MYTHGQNDQQLAVAVSIAPADPLAGARWFPGYQKIKLRAIWATITTQTAAAIITLTFKYRPTPGSASGEIIIGTVVVPIGALVGKTYYRDIVATDVPCPSGGEVVVQAAGAGTGNATVGITYEPTPDIPENNANMIASA